MTDYPITHATGMLQRVGTNQERQYLMEVLAEQLGIPAREAGRADVVAILANAVSRSVQYGWLPGVHMHIQKFESKQSKDARKVNPNLAPVFTYTLVDGEKAWKDSGGRWRTEFGVNWRYQRKPMTTQEVAEEAKLMGYNQPIAPNSFGYWCRIIEEGDDPNSPDDPTWSAGVWFGKVSVGSYWFDDSLPTGNSSRDVAMRRADKRAMMQSRLSLLPLTGNDENERLGNLVTNLRREAERRQKDSEPVHKPPLNRDEDGQVLFASKPPAKVAPAVQQEDTVDGAWQHEEPTTPEDADFGWTENEQDLEPYTWIMHNTDLTIPKAALACITFLRDKHDASSEKMSPQDYGKLAGLLDVQIGEGKSVHGMILSCATGEIVGRKNRPGSLVGGLIAWLEAPEKNPTRIEALKEILALCMEVKGELEDETVSDA